MKNKYIELHNLTKIYHSMSNENVKALNNINLELPSTGMVFFIGRSGSGKSTMLNMLGGIDNPTSGSIIYKGMDIANIKGNRLDEYRSLVVGFVFQEYHLLNDLNVCENIKLSTDLIGISPSEEELDTLLDQLEIKELKNKKVTELSGGQKQRVAIARSLIKKPSFLLADEPTGALDYATGQELFKTLKSLSKQQLVIVVSHDYSSALSFADRIIELSDGEVIEDKEITKIDDTGAFEVSLFKRPKASFKGLVKMSFKGMLKKKIRLTAVLIITLALLIACGLVATFTRYDRNEVFLKEMYRSGNYYLPLTRQEGISEEKKARVNDLLHNHELASTFSTRNNVYAIDFLSGFIRTYPDRIMELSEEEFSRLNLKVLHGRIPSADNEIMIRSRDYDILMRDEIFEIGNELVRFTSFDEISNYTFGSEKVIKMTGGFRISGVFEYSDVQLNASTIYQSNYWNIEHSETFNMSSMTIMNKGFLERYLGAFNMNNAALVELFGWIFAPAIYNGVTGGQTCSFGVYGATPAQKQYKEDPPYPNTLPGKLITADGKDITSLSGNEAILPITYLRGLRSKNNISAASMLGEYAEEAIKEYASLFYPSIASAFEEDFPNGSLEGYIEYIYQSEENKYDPDRNYTYFDNNGLEYLASRFFSGEFYDFDIGLGFGDEYSKRIDIKGFYFIDEDPRYIFYNTLFLTNEVYQELIGQYTTLDYTDYYIILSGNLEKDLALLRLMNDLTSNVKDKAITEFAWGNYLLLNIVHLERQIMRIGEMASYLMIVLSIFTFALIYSYFQSIVSSDRKRIGILRSIGMKKSSVFFIYMLRSAVLATIISIPAILATKELVSYVNSVITRATVDYNFAFFGSHSIMAILGLNFLAMSLSSFIPIWRISKMSPVEAINSIR